MQTLVAKLNGNDARDKLHHPQDCHPRRETIPSVAMFLRNGLGVLYIALSLAAASAAQMISVDLTGTTAGGGGLEESYLISGDGRYAAFASSGTNYVANDTNGISDVFVYDCVGRSNVWNTCYSAGALDGFFGSRPVDFTPDGRFLLFLSRTTNHVPGLTFSGGESYQLHVRDLVSNVTHLASAALDGTNVANWFYSGAFPARGFTLQYLRHRISSDGRFVVFASQGTNLVPEVTNAGWNLYRRDLVLQTTEVTTLHPGGVPVLDFAKGRFFCSTNARYVAFDATANNVGPGLTNNGLRHTYWRDRLVPTNVLVDVTADGAPAIRESFLHDLSSDGRFVAFTSFATNLTTDVIDDNGTYDLFVRDMWLGETWTVTRSTNDHTTNGRHQGARFSHNGEWLIFGADTVDMAPGIEDLSGSNDTLIHHLPTRTNGLLSISFTGHQSASHFAGDGFARLSSSGRFTLFTTIATNLAPNTPNVANRLYLRDQQAGTTRNAFHTGTFPTPSFNEARHAISANERYIFFLSDGNFDPAINHPTSSLELFRAPLYPPLLILSNNVIHADALAGATYVLESSGNLLQWTAINTNTADATGAFTVTDPQPPSGSNCFYRLSWP